MKREDLTKIGVGEDLVERIMAMHGQDIEKHKSATETAKAEMDALKAQLTEASTTIEGFKKLDVDSIRAAADDWKTKAEQAQVEAQKQVAALKFDHALEGALSGAKARNPKAVRALLQQDALKLNEADGSILGLKEQLEKIKSEADYLFEAEGNTPKIVAGGNNQTVLDDPFMAALRKGAGLSTEGK